MWRKSLVLFQAALTDFFRNNCHQMAAGIAFWTMFSLFPLALVGVSLLGSIYSTPDRQRQLVEGLERVMPVSADYLANVIEEVVRVQGGLGTLAFAGLLVSGTAMFSAVRRSINHAWHIGLPSYFLRDLTTDLGMMLGAIVLVFVEVIVTTNMLGFVHLAPWSPRDSLVAKAILEISALIATFGVFLLIHRFVPNTKVSWSDVWLGALSSATLFQVLYLGLTWFFADFFSFNFNLVYGPLSALMAAMTWIYLSAVALIWGAELSYMYSHLWGSHAAEGLMEDLRPKYAGARRKGFRGSVDMITSWILPPKRTPP